MTLQTRQRWILFFTLLVILAVLAWFYPLNRGTLRLTGAEPPYAVTIENRAYSCSVDPCDIALPAGLHRVEFQKERYQPFSVNVTVRRFRVAGATLNAVRVFGLEPSHVVPPEKKPLPATPVALKTATVVAPTWSPDQTRVIYWDKNEGRVKIWSAAGTLTVAALKGPFESLQFFWSPDQTRAAALQGRDLFWLDLKAETRRKTSLAFDPAGMLWAGARVLLNDAAKGLYALEAGDPQPRALGFEADLAQARWLAQGTLVYYKNDPDLNRVSIEAWTPERGQSVWLVQSDAQFDQLESNGEKVVYFHDPKQKGWRELAL